MHRLVSNAATPSLLVPMLRIPALTLALLAAGVADASSQGPGEIPLGKPLAELAHPFSDVVTPIDLPDGRVLLVDREERAVNVVDFARGSATVVGREGSGPGEYRRPSRLVSMPGDTVLIRDIARFVVLAPGATVTGSVIAERLVASTSPYGADRQGRMYFQAPIFDRAAGGGARDSVPLYRVDLAAKRADTLAWVHVTNPDIEKAKTSPGDGRQTFQLRTTPFDQADLWSVGADGTIYIARIRDYHVDIIAPDGRRVAGPPIPYERVEFTREERRRFADLPRHRPPFVRNPHPVHRVSPEGRFWVPRLTAREGDPERYDVIDRNGRLVQRLVFPSGVKLAGLGGTYVYGVREDADGFFWLQRYAYPGR